MKIYTILAMALFAFGPLTGYAQIVIASDDFDSPVNRVSLDITVDMAFMNPGDIFGVTTSNTSAPDNTPFAVVDDGNPVCPNHFPTDNQGAIACTYDNNFFAMSDTENPNNMGDVMADWVFDISSATNLSSISIDMAAMGDFETSNDNFIWSYSIDGGPFNTIFDMMPDEAINADYLLQNGSIRTLNDPMKVNGTLVINELQTFTAAVTGSGNQLTLRLVGMGDGGSEAIVWDNIVVSGFASGAPIPTMSEWGMFLFALIMITFGVVFVFNSQHRLAFAGPKGVSGSINTQKLPFHKETYSSALISALALTVPGFILIYFGWGEIVGADLIGMAITVPIVAYLIHLVRLFGKGE